MDVKKRIVVWCGNAPNQKALANKLHQEFSVAGIVIDKKENKNKTKRASGFVNKVYEFVRFRSINSAWRKLQAYYDSRYIQWPEVPILEVESINRAEAKKFTENFTPHLIVVSGTSLVKESMLDTTTEIGILNLHTGLSPYVKGGPNCTNWCIANKDWHLVGNTIMWINAGIDTGNIVTSETIDIRECSSLFQAHYEVMEHAHDLYSRAIQYVLQSTPPYLSVPQNHLGKGKLYLTKMWDKECKKRLLKNWRERKHLNQNNASPQTISLPK